MAEERREESGFKVVDRRTFTSEGTRREGAPSVVEKPPEEAEKPSSAPEQTRRDAREDRLDEGFAMLVEFLANSALVHLGMVAGPAGETIPVDLQSARAMIDLLGVIQDKTKGNLTSSESKLLGDILFELHTRFVELQKQATAKRR